MNTVHVVTYGETVCEKGQTVHSWNECKSILSLCRVNKPRAVPWKTIQWETIDFLTQKNLNQELIITVMQMNKGKDNSVYRSSL